jgi:hypothetical protein
MNLRRYHAYMLSCPVDDGEVVLHSDAEVIEKDNEALRNNNKTLLDEKFELMARVTEMSKEITVLKQFQEILTKSKLNLQNRLDSEVSQNVDSLTFIRKVSQIKPDMASQHWAKNCLEGCLLCEAERIVRDFSHNDY